MGKILEKKIFTSLFFEAHVYEARFATRSPGFEISNGGLLSNSSQNIALMPLENLKGQF